MPTWWTPEWVTAAGTLMQGVLTALSLGAAVWAFSNWRRERIGGRRIELAEEASALMHEARDIIHAVRSPLVQYTIEEAAKIAEKWELSEGDAETFLIFQAPLRRLADNAEFFARMRVLRPRVLVVLGEEGAAPFAKVLGIHTEIIVAAESLLGSIRELHEPELRQDAAAWRRTISGRGWRDDTIGPRMDEAVAAMEVVARRHLGSSRPRRGWPKLRFIGSKVYLDWPGINRRQT